MPVKRSKFSKLLDLDTFNHRRHGFATLQVGGAVMDKSSNHWIMGAELWDADDSLYDDSNPCCTPEEYDAFLLREQKRSMFRGLTDDSWIPPVTSKKTRALVNPNTINNAINKVITKSQYVAVNASSTVSSNPITVPNLYVNSSVVTNDVNSIIPNGNTTYQTPTFDNSVAHLLYFAQAQTRQTLQAAMESIMSDIRLEPGKAATITLPDGAKIAVDALGNYVIDDKDAKVVYKANRNRDFNPYINVSDKLEEFIAYCGRLEVTQDEMLALPIHLFIMWLVVEAARADKLEESDQPLLAGLQQVKSKALNKCTQCGRFMRKILKQRQINHCSTQCFEIACA